MTMLIVCLSVCLSPTSKAHVICKFLLVINSNYGRFRDIDAQNQKIAGFYPVFPTPPLFDDPLVGSGNPLEFLDETYPAKTRRIRLPYYENCIMMHTPCDRRTEILQTDGRQHIQRAKHAVASNLSCNGRKLRPSHHVHWCTACEKIVQQVATTFRLSMSCRLPSLLLLTTYDV